MLTDTQHARAKHIAWNLFEKCNVSTNTRVVQTDQNNKQCTSFATYCHCHIGDFNDTRFANMKRWLIGASDDKYRRSIYLAVMPSISPLGELYQRIVRWSIESLFKSTSGFVIEQVLPFWGETHIHSERSTEPLSICLLCAADCWDDLPMTCTIPTGGFEHHTTISSTGARQYVKVLGSNGKPIWASQRARMRYSEISGDEERHRYITPISYQPYVTISTRCLHHVHKCYRSKDDV